MCLSLYFLRDLAFNNEYTGKQGKKQTEGKIPTHIHSIHSIMCSWNYKYLLQCKSKLFNIYIFLIKCLN